MYIFKCFDAILAEEYSENTNYVKGINPGGDKKLILTPDEQLNDIYKKYIDTKYWLKAPNGKKSKLSEKQWLQVRTPNFKRWFGDWEYDPKNASKVLDENGEPMIVYHGTNIPIDKIDIFKSGDVGWLGPGIYLTPFTEYALQFSSYKKEGLIPLFLNIRKPLVLTEFWRVGHPYLELLKILYGTEANGIYKKRRDAVINRDSEILRNMPHDGAREQYINRRIITKKELMLLLTSYDGINWDDGEYCVIDANKVKHATKNSGEFSQHANSIYGATEEL